MRLLDRRVRRGARALNRNARAAAPRRRRRGSRRRQDKAPIAAEHDAAREAIWRAGALDADAHHCSDVTR